MPTGYLSYVNISMKLCKVTQVIRNTNMTYPFDKILTCLLHTIFNIQHSVYLKIILISYLSLNVVVLAVKHVVVILEM